MNDLLYSPYWRLTRLVAIASHYVHTTDQLHYPGRDNTLKYGNWPWHWCHFVTLEMSWRCRSRRSCYSSEYIVTRMLSQLIDLPTHLYPNSFLYPDFLTLPSDIYCWITVLTDEVFTMVKASSIRTFHGLLDKELPSNSTYSENGTISSFQWVGTKKFPRK